MATSDGPVAFVEEAVFVSAEHDFCYMSGRFSAYCAVDEPTGFYEQGPQGVTSGEAIAWAREHAPVVIVLVGEERRRYSAGERQPASTSLPPWPAEGLARPAV